MKLANETRHVEHTFETFSQLEAKSNHGGSAQQDLLQKAVAGLSDSAIRDMSPRELRFAVRTAGALLIPPLEDEQLEFADRGTLERLVFLTRRACRHRYDEANGQRTIPR